MKRTAHTSRLNVHDLSASPKTCIRISYSVFFSFFLLGWNRLASDKDATSGLLPERNEEFGVCRVFFFTYIIFLNIYFDRKSYTRILHCLFCAEINACRPDGDQSYVFGDQQNVRCDFSSVCSPLFYASTWEPNLELFDANYKWRKRRGPRGFGHCAVEFNFAAIRISFT